MDGLVGSTLPLVCAPDAGAALDAVVSVPAVLCVGALGGVGGVLVPVVDADVSVPAALCVGAFGLAGWALWPGEALVAVSALGAVVGALVAPDGT